MKEKIIISIFFLSFKKGHWHVPFNASETKEQDFHTSRGKSVKKPMMHLLQSLYYHVDADIGARVSFFYFYLYVFYVFK